jgi:predicted Co/Zn/Cd cation transporter (cation efflux family)
VLLCLTVALVWLYSEYVLILFSGVYALVGVVLHSVRLLRHRMVSRTAT